MKRLFLLLLVCTVAFAEFKLQNVGVEIKIAEDGTANVEEKTDIIVFGEYSMQLYESGFNTNTLAGWREITGITEIKTHVGTKSVVVKNVLIRPQPLQKSKSALDVWYGQIIVDYVAVPYYDKDDKPVKNTGVVSMDSYKPRTTRYALNENALDFPRTNTGDIKLDEETTLSITQPAGALMIYVNPITSDLHDIQLPAPARKLSWSGLTLVQFSLVYEVEESLDKEVLGFFSDLQDSIRTSLLSQEGIAAVVVAAIMVLSYFYLRLSRR